MSLGADNRSWESGGGLLLLLLPGGSSESREESQEERQKESKNRLTKRKVETVREKERFSMSLFFNSLLQHSTVITDSFLNT